MAERMTGPFTASFVYTEEILADFEALYLRKRKMTPVTRLLCGGIGLAGILYFGWQLYQNGMGVTTLGYLVICSLAFLVAVSGGRTRGDETISKYKKYYTNTETTFRIDENGIEMKLASQKHPAKTKFNHIYSLLETELCFYFVISGKAYYILPKAAIEGGSPEDLKKYLQQHCRKTFQSFLP